MSEAEAEDNSVFYVMCVSCQQAASGAPKCAICDQVCHAIIPCTTATDDEDVLEQMISERSQQEVVSLLVFLSTLLLDIYRNNNYNECVLFTTNMTSFSQSSANMFCISVLDVQRLNCY